MARLGKATKKTLALLVGAALLPLFTFIPLQAQQSPASSGSPAQIFEAGWMGISVQDITPQKAQELKLPGVYGVQVAYVGGETPASAAGLKKGDVITEYNGQQVEGVLQFQRLVRETPPGRTVNLTVWRDGHSQSLSVQIGQNPQAAPFERMLRGFGNFAPDIPPFEFGPARPAMAVLGIRVEDLSAQLGAFFNVPNGEGVLITSVEPDSAASKAGLRAGDVITAVEGTPVRNVRELRYQLREHRNSNVLALRIIRNKAEMSVDVTPRTRQSAAPAPNIPL